MSLHDIVLQTASRSPDALAMKDAHQSMTYRELTTTADRFAGCLEQLGVQSGDRVGIWLEKSVLVVAAMQGVLRVKAAYVPLDPLSPTARISAIVQDCELHVLITTQSRAKDLQASSSTHILCLDEGPYGQYWQAPTFSATSPIRKLSPCQHEIAYILYTSGSTGRPKGVCISHQNALAFIQWALTMVQATPADHFANHAPFHFDLSVLDLYVAFATGAAIYLIPEQIAYLPTSLLDFVKKEQISIWYSVPSVLLLMMQDEQRFPQSLRSLRMILYAGEAFPPKPLRRLRQALPAIRLFNLYGPTETNVCTFYEVKTVPDDGVPIGRACSGNRVWARKEDGTQAQPGEEGELMVEGPSVMLGYWGQPEQGNRPYATGDRVLVLADENYLYRGRYDQLIKIRGYRVEPGDIEAILAQHPAIQEAVVLVTGTDLEARLLAFVTCPNCAPPTLLEIKRYCAEHLPRYMIINGLHVLSSFPRTRNGKIDRLALLQQLAQKSKQEDDE